MSASTGPKDSPENTHFSGQELEAVVQEAKRRQVFDQSAKDEFSKQLLINII